MNRTIKNIQVFVSTLKEGHKMVFLIFVFLLGLYGFEEVRQNQNGLAMVGELTEKGCPMWKLHI